MFAVTINRTSAYTRCFCVYLLKITLKFFVYECLVTVFGFFVHQLNLSNTKARNYCTQNFGAN